MTNKALPTTHARWLDSVVAHPIVDVRHVPGVTNVVSDGLSRRDTGRPRNETDGSTETVSPDWYTKSGAVFDMYQVTPKEEECDQLEERFQQVPLYRDVVRALRSAEDTDDTREAKRARHRALEYMIDDGRLWRVGGGKWRRARPRVECLNADEMMREARKEHARGGHLHRDAMKRKLADRFQTPGMDRIIMDAIRA
ncbi:hypothetical protein GGG16DRAFT_48964, partial [Schizophyllum commune]